MALIALCQWMKSRSLLEDHTRSTFALPFSLTWKANEVSRLLFESLTCRKAWCGRFTLLSSFVVSRILRFSVDPSCTGLLRILEGRILRSIR